MVNIKLNFFLAFKYENVIVKMVIINIAGRSIRLNTPKKMVFYQILIKKSSTSASYKICIINATLNQINKVLS